MLDLRHETEYQQVNNQKQVIYHEMDGVTPSKVIEELYANFLRTRSSVMSSNIMSVADDQQAAHARELATPASKGRPLGDTIEDVLQIMSHRMAMDHPRFFGFIPCPVHKSSYLGDIITTMFNVHAGSWMQSSGPSAVEDELLKWFAQKAGLPRPAGGVFVSGGSMANLTAIIAARDTRLEFQQRAKAVIYLSEQTHSSIQKGLGIAGFHASQIRHVECDERHLMKVSSLRSAIAADRSAGLAPFLIVATCGLTNTGGIDPLNELADIAEAESLWLHVDGAYGASILLSQNHKHLANGIGRAHSISWDAHKWLFQTYDCGFLLVRDVRDLSTTFATQGTYIQDADQASSENVNFWNRGIELTRPARAMKLWFTLQILGIDKPGDLIDHGIHLAEEAERAFRNLKSWEIVCPAQLAILNFRYISPSRSRGQSQRSTAEEQFCDRVNVEISKRAISRNIAACLTTKLNGRLTLRMCTISPLLEREGIVQVVGELDELAGEIMGELEDGLGRWH